MDRLCCIDDFLPGTLVRWKWAPKGFGQSAIEQGVRPMGRVVDKATLPRMGCETGIQVLDDPSWVIDPVFALSKGHESFKVREGQ